MLPGVWGEGVARLTARADSHWGFQRLCYVRGERVVTLSAGQPLS